MTTDPARPPHTEAEPMRGTSSLGTWTRRSAPAQARMRHGAFVVLVLAVAGVLLGGCSDDDPDDVTPSPTQMERDSTTTEPSTVPGGTGDQGGDPLGGTGGTEAPSGDGTMPSPDVTTEGGRPGDEEADVPGADG